MKISHPIVEDMEDGYGHKERRVRGRIGGDSEDEQTGSGSEDV